jgi:hypothetical protein
MAGIQSTKVSHYRVQSFSGGLNTSTDPSLLEDNEASDLLNVDFDVKGVVQKRPAVRVFKDLGFTNSIQAIYDFHRKDNSFERLYFYDEYDPNGGQYPPGEEPFNTGFRVLVETAYGSKNLEFYSEDGLTVYNFAEHTPTDPFDEIKDRKFCFFTFNDKMYMTNAVDGLFVYDDTVDGNKIIKTPLGTVADNTIVNFIQPCRYAVVHKNRVFYAGFPNDSDKFYFSELGKPEGVKREVADEFGKTSATGGGYFIIPSNDTEITGLGTFLDKLIIFKLNSAYVLSGTFADDFDLGRINVNDGCISHDTIVLGNNFLYFLSPTGLNYLYSPDQQMIETKSLSTKIENTLIKEDLKNSFAIFYRSSYFLFTSNFLFIYDEELKCWTKHDIKMTFAMSDVENGKVLMVNGKFTTVSVPPLSPYIYTFDSSKLNDEYDKGIETAIKCIYQTRYFDFMEPELQKRLKFVKIFFLPTTGVGEIRLIQEINYRSQTRFVDTSYNSLFWGVQDWGSGIWGAAVDFLSKKVPIGGQGEYVRYTFVNDKLDQEFKIYAFIVGFKRKSKVR